MDEPHLSLKTARDAFSLELDLNVPDNYFDKFPNYFKQLLKN